MRFTLLVLSFLLISLTIQSQPWLKLLPDYKSSAQLTLHDYKQAFYAYWEPFNVVDGYYTQNGTKVKAPGYKQFKRWEWLQEQRVDLITGAFPDKSALEIEREYYRAHPLRRSSLSSMWISLGPNTSAGGGQGLGRINCIAFHPTDPNTTWTGSPSGGLWVTHDDGQSWTCLTDHEESMGVTDIIVNIDFESSQTIYIATGDRDSYDNQSIGVLKSIDGGISWTQTGLRFELADHQVINRLLQDPVDNNVLFAATDLGVIKTTDAGATWNEVLTEMEFIDMEINPVNSNILLGSTFDGEIYVTINGGATWSRKLYVQDAGRVELAVTPADPSRVYAIGSSGGLEGIYRSEDSGNTFEKVFDGDTLNLLHWDDAGIGDGGQGWYDLAIAASPLDANTLFVGGINTWRSSDGGESWKIVNHFTGNSAQVVHADKHALVFGHNGDLWEGNDGGIYVSRDTGTSWTDKTNGMAITQVYRMGVSQTELFEVITGSQDNGTKLYSGSSWEQVNGADGTEGMIDYTDANIQYSTTQSGSIFRTYDHWASARYVKAPDAGEGAWVTPFAIDPVDPKIIYGGYREVWKTIDRCTTWTKISTINAYDKIRSIAIAPSDTKVIYVAENGRMWKTITGEEPFVKVTGSDVTNTNFITYLAVKKDDPLTVWASIGGFWNPGVFETHDGGNTWEDITQGLPPIPVYTIIQNYQSDQVQLFAGTELSVFIKTGDEDWTPFKEGLPNVIVTELEMYYAPDPTQSKLRASTYGRGIWETRIEFSSTPMEYVSGTTEQASTTLVKPNSINQEILRIRIITNDDLEPLHASSFLFNTNGSSDPDGDIIIARLFYTGAVNTFSNASEIGTASLPDGEFTISCDQPLIHGENYFWLTYDVALEAKLGNKLDAQCTSFLIDEIRTPSESDPQGHRYIEVFYCHAGSTFLTSEYISRVIAGNVDQSSVKGPLGYYDFTDRIVEMEMGEFIEVAVTNAIPHPTNEVRVWIDWNQDGEFAYPDELVYASGPLGVSTYNFSMAPTVNARLGMTRMRIRLHDTNFGANWEPCGNSNLGEVEDYSVNIAEATTAIPNTITDQVRIFPNPSSDEIVILVRDNPNFKKIHLVDMLGHVVYEGSMNEQALINVKGFSAGIYFIHIGTESGPQISKIVIN